MKKILTILLVLVLTIGMVSLSHAAIPADTYYQCSMAAKSTDGATTALHLLGAKQDGKIAFIFPNSAADDITALLNGLDAATVSLKVANNLSYAPSKNFAALTVDRETFTAAETEVKKDVLEAMVNGFIAGTDRIHYQKTLADQAAAQRAQKQVSSAADGDDCDGDHEMELPEDAPK